jgi:uncharacterized delta-60 repeat protein
LLDASFDAGLSPDFVAATAVQPDGKTIIAGYFSTDGGATYVNVARLKADGSVDATFAANTDNVVSGVAVLPDGKIVIAGDFTNVNGTNGINRIARLNADGTRDTNFNSGGAGTNFQVFCIAVQADGKLVLGGEFTSVNGTTVGHIARLNPTGTLDASFNFGGSGADATVRGVAIDADGKLVLGGDFAKVNGTNVGHVARLNADGTLDTGFNAGGAGANANVLSVAVQADGKLVFGGVFTSINSTNGLNRIARLNTDGAVDTSFNPGGAGANAGVATVAVQADGRLVLGGDFGQVNTTVAGGFARLNADGTPDASFNPGGSGADSSVFTLAARADGKLLLGGYFSSINDTARNAIALLHNAAATESLAAPDQGQVLWTRGGAAPEVSHVAFEQSSDGGANWTALGAGVRVGTTANWQLTGLALPPTGKVRARGRTNAAGSTGLVESIASYAVADIAVAQSSALTDGAGSVSFGSVNMGSSSAAFTFTITNPGAADLMNLAITKDGANKDDFAVSTLSGTSVPVGSGSATFTVTFTPGAVGTRDAAIHIASNVGGAKSPFDIALTGTGADVTPPDTLITSGPDALTAATTATITFNGSDDATPGASLTFEGRLDVGGFAPVSSPVQLTSLALGTHTYEVRAKDAADNLDPTPASITWTVRPAAPVNTALIAKDATPPDAGTPGIPGGPATDSTLVSFGVPCIDETGSISYLAKWDGPNGKGSGLFHDDNCLIGLGGDVAGITGAKFKSLGDPVGSGGKVALLAKITGVAPSQAAVVLSNAGGGREPQVIAQAGTVALDSAGTPLADGAKFKSFKGVAISGDYTAVLAQLAAPATSDAGLWVKDGSDPLKLVLREGQTLSIGETIKTLVSFAAGNGSPGQGRGWLIEKPASGAEVMALALFVSKRQGIVVVDTANPANPLVRPVRLVSGVAGPGGPFVTGVANPTFASYGPPARNSGLFTAFRGALTVNTANGVTKANASAIFSGPTAGGFYPAVARVGDDAGTTGAQFSVVKDPVLAGDDTFVFPATLKGTTVKGPSAKTLWWLPAGRAFGLLAQGGVNTSIVGNDLPTGAQWKTFDSLAVAAVRGPIFTGKLIPNLGDVTKATASGVWAMDFTGTLRTLFRTGDTTIIAGKTLKTFTLLNATVGTGGVTRSFNDAGQVVWLATFTDKSQAIVVTDVP